MTHYILLIDFGASRVKSAIVDVNNGSFSNIQSRSSISPCVKTARQYEVSPHSLRDQFVSICNSYSNDLNMEFEGIVLCSEMHGFALLGRDGKVKTNYISWKDERSLSPVNGLDTFSLVNDELGGEFRRITGMNPRPGLPFINALHLGRTGQLEKGCRIISLPDLLALSSDDAKEMSHSTMLAGLGFYDVSQGRVSQQLLAFFENTTGIALRLNDRVPIGSVAGYWHSKTKKIPIYVAVGDHQCAVLGACNVPRETISINIGTGSQVSIIDKDVDGQIEIRPFFNSSLLTTITHIPAGRVLKEYLGFLEDIVTHCGLTNIDFWSIMQKLKKEDILSSTLDFDLSLFRSAWNYQKGGRIGNITENSLTLLNYVGSLVNNFVKQYLEVIAILDPLAEVHEYILSGGIPRRLPVLQEVFTYSKKGVKITNSAEIDETLIGLRTLSMMCLKYASDYLQAQKIYGRQALVA